jgi:hypothetical protein
MGKQRARRHSTAAAGRPVARYAYYVASSKDEEARQLQASDADKQPTSILSG